jgi:hypothetical protein
LAWNVDAAHAFKPRMNNCTAIHPLVERVGGNPATD